MLASLSLSTHGSIDAFAIGVLVCRTTRPAFRQEMNSKGKVKRESHCDP